MHPVQFSQIPLYVPEVGYQLWAVRKLLHCIQPGVYGGDAPQGAAEPYPQQPLAPCRQQASRWLILLFVPTEHPPPSTLRMFQGLVVAFPPCQLVLPPKQNQMPKQDHLNHLNEGVAPTSLVGMLKLCPAHFCARSAFKHADWKQVVLSN